MRRVNIFPRFSELRQNSKRLPPCCGSLDPRDRSGKALFPELRVGSKGFAATKFAENRVSGSISRNLWVREFQRLGGDSGILQAHHVGEVILFDPPRWLRSLLRQFRERALHIARGE